MILRNWDIFKAKFSEDPRFNFEWFCRLLFCKEFNKPYGIFSYFNQSVIETDPINIGNDVIGFQAKFWTTPLSKNKSEIIKCLEEYKRNYPAATKLYFYSNQDWTQYNGGKTRAQIEIENKAKDLSLGLEWRLDGYFLSENVCIHNEAITKYFFTNDKSIFDLSKSFQEHTKGIFDGIHTKINTDIEISRDNELEQIRAFNSNVIIINGEAGVGKTALIKNLYEHLNNDTPLFLFKATEFEVRHINEITHNVDFYSFFKAYNDENIKIIVIDSAEKLLDLKNQDPLKEFLSTIIQYNWKIIFTTRDNYLDDLIFLISETCKVIPEQIRINNLQPSELTKLANEHLFQLPKDEKLLDLIKNPFYLKQYLSFSNQTTLNYHNFKANLWDRTIKKSKPSRETCFMQIAFERANQGQFFITPNFELKLLDQLVTDGILGYESSGYFITHDIYEEWALEKIIKNKFTQRSNNKDFFCNIGQSLPIRRSLRNWISEELLQNHGEIISFIEDVIDDKHIEQFWQDEFLISVLFSDYSVTFFDNFKAKLLSNELAALKRLIFILRLACKELDIESLKYSGNSNDGNMLSWKHVLTRPKGQGWNCCQARFKIPHSPDLIFPT